MNRIQDLFFRHARCVASWWCGLARSGRIVAVVAYAGLLVVFAGCARSDATRVTLHVQPSNDSDIGRVEIMAQVSGPQAGVRYTWFAVAGTCQPQETEWPTTVFRFSPGATRDRVSVVVRRDGQVVAESSVDLSMDEKRAVVQNSLIPAVGVEISTVPPYDPHGGPETRADISGTVSGEIKPGYKVLVYARADAWYIQPVGGAQHSIQPDNSWSTWTHTGSSYAVLVVRPGFEPFARLDVLPQVGGYVVARAVVDGKGR